MFNRFSNANEEFVPPFRRYYYALFDGAANAIQCSRCKAGPRCAGVCVCVCELFTHKNIYNYDFVTMGLLGCILWEMQEVCCDASGFTVTFVTTLVLQPGMDTSIPLLCGSAVAKILDDIWPVQNNSGELSRRDSI